MSERVVEVQADSLQEAREKVRAQVPEGLHLVSQKVVSTGKPKTVKCASDTMQDAFTRAFGKVPAGADILEKRELRVPERSLVVVEAYDEQTARAEAQRQIGKTARVEGIALTEHGSKGLFGIGRKPNRYDVQVFQQAIAAITYREQVKIRATIGEKTLSRRQRRATTPSFRIESLRAIILYMQNVSAPPGGGGFAFDVFTSLNEPDLHKLLAACLNPDIQARNLQIDDYQRFVSRVTTLASGEMRSFSDKCLLVMQPNTILVPGTGPRNVVLCSFFAVEEDAVIVLEPRQKYRLA